jgi:hypothetical protein
MVRSTPFIVRNTVPSAPARWTTIGSVVVDVSISVVVEASVTVVVDAAATVVAGATGADVEGASVTTVPGSDASRAGAPEHESPTTEPTNIHRTALRTAST